VRQAGCRSTRPGRTRPEPGRSDSAWAMPKSRPPRGEPPARRRTPPCSTILRLMPASRVVAQGLGCVDAGVLRRSASSLSIRVTSRRWPPPERTGPTGGTHRTTRQGGPRPRAGRAPRSRWPPVGPGRGRAQERGTSVGHVHHSVPGVQARAWPVGHNNRTSTNSRTLTNAMRTMPTKTWSRRYDARDRVIEQAESLAGAHRLRDDRAQHGVGGRHLEAGEERGKGDGTWTRRRRARRPPPMLRTRSSRSSSVASMPATVGHHRWGRTRSGPPP